MNMQLSGTQFDRENEGKCCDAIIRVLEQRTGIKRDIQRFFLNAKAPGTDKNVEIRLALSENYYAIEHTRLRGFGNIETKKHKYFIQFRDLIKRENFPISGTYILYVESLPPNILKDVSRLEALVSWACQAATELYARWQADCSSSERVEKTGAPWGIGFPVKLVREFWSSENVGRLDVRLNLPPGEKESLEEQIDSALEAKCPKLKAHKDTGARSILILEMMGTNINIHQVVYFLQSALENRTDPPDDIFIVDSLMSNWMVIQVKDGSKDVGWGGGVPPQFPSSELIDVTGVT